ncbi:hypothetical protein SAMN05421766_1069 [Zobellia uliginosa]|uniref:HEAT repeat-containing protein n=1 Tax=Zobellia uliginosa TaxID=143224 RepID=A0ABY1KZF6_9FLAO|nr:HEAT repeat domain-containing protein [Zobellia uliginosa]SIS97468.1 hypothetical protein SAMN05421766_1069 [Zobellia uliginosa]
MISIEELKHEYNTYKNEGTLMDNVFELKEHLLSSDSKEFLEFHYSILDDNSIPEGPKNMIISFFYSDVVNKRDKTVVSDFLYEKYKTESDLEKKARLIQILGHLRSPLVKEIVEKEIKSPIRDIRYRCLIVMGWVGTSVEDLNILNERMLNDEDGQLRGYAATAMRQIWYNKKSVKNRVTRYIKEAIVNESNTEALTGMIITIQDLHKKKLGVKESNYGDISGDVQKAKLKTIKMLEKLK